MSLDQKLIDMIENAVARAEEKHPSLGSDPYGVIMEEVEEARAEYYVGQAGREMEELLDVIAPCVRRIKALMA